MRYADRQRLYQHARHLCWSVGVASLVLCGAPAGAQRQARPMVLLDLPASPRALALGDAYAASSDDAASLFYDPAQLDGTVSRSAELSVQRYAAGSTLGSLALGAHFGRVGVGFGIRSIAYGTVDRIECDPATACERGVLAGGTVHAGDIAMTLGAARAFGPLRIGVAGTTMSQQTADMSGSATTLDVGMSSRVAGATVGASVQQIASRVRAGAARDPLPRTLRAGVAVPVHSSGSVRVQGLADYVLRDGLGQLCGGPEAEWSGGSGVTLIARAGARTRRAGDLAGAVTAGGGLLVRRVTVDYAYDALRDLGGTHRFGVRWSQ